MELYGVRQRKSQSVLLTGIFMAIMAAGIYQAFCEAFGYSKGYREIYFSIIAFTCIFAVTGIFNSIIKNILYGAYAATFGVYSLIYVDYLKENMDVLISYVMTVRQDYLYADETSGNNALPDNMQFECSGKAAVIILIGILLLIMAVCIFSLKNAMWSILPVIAVVMLGMLYGKTPSVSTCIFIFIGAIGIIFIIVNRRMERKNKYAGCIIMAVILVISISISNFAMKRTKEQILSKNAEVLEKQHEYERTAKNIADSIVERIQNVTYKGKMSNTSPVYTGKDVFTVTLDKRPGSKIYFKEFSADTYNNGIWTNKADDSAFFSYSIKNIFSYGYRSIRKNPGMAEAAKNINMQIKYADKAGNGDRKLSVPYFSNIADININGKTVDGKSKISDNGIKLNDAERSITRKADNYYLKYYDMSDSALDIVLDSVSDRINDNDYAQYVYENYLGVPEDERLEEFAKEIKSVSVLSKQCDGIKKALQKDTQYTTNPGRLPFGKDYLDYFLFENKKGYCEHYATASTILLRLKNIPARYAAGYAVSPDQFIKKVKRDSTGKIKKTYYVAEVHDHDAHAWSEIYKDGTGWVPVDMTKALPESNRAKQETTEPAQSADLKTAENKAQKSTKKPYSGKKTKSKGRKNKTDKKTITEKKGRNDKEGLKDTLKNDKEKSVEKQQKNNMHKSRTKTLLSVPLYIKIIAGMIIIIIIFVAYFYYAKRLIYDFCYRKKIGKAQTNSEILFIARKFMTKYLGMYGRGLEKFSDDEYIEELGKICILGNFEKIFQKAAFSKDDITEQELLECLERMEDIAKYIRAEKPLQCPDFELNLIQNYIIEKTK